ncbi:response regulator [Aquabacterium sp. A7-Y]|uniref:response regulator n=1 Tax=Aquabacterium sp. A7-Y TaxID=1349605 RepID=UPI00223CEFF5|nr:response regulator [Aquabacterium sp. A7-Y]MCW7537043.1 response regulator [Aquabacterium sp. A7-Y]
MNTPFPSFPSGSRHAAPKDLDGTPLRVLLADDDAVSTMTAQAALESFGCSVTLAADGVSALKTAVDGCFDLLLVDYHMPYMNGRAVARALRALEAAKGQHATRIVGLSAGASAEERRQCLDAGMDAVLPKPFVLADLRKLVLRWVSPESPQAPHMPPHLTRGDTRGSA